MHALSLSLSCAFGVGQHLVCWKNWGQTQIGMDKRPQEKVSIFPFREDRSNERRTFSGAYTWLVCSLKFLESYLFWGNSGNTSLKRTLLLLLLPKKEIQPSVASIVWATQHILIRLPWQRWLVEARVAARWLRRSEVCKPSRFCDVRVHGCCRLVICDECGGPQPRHSGVTNDALIIKPSQELPWQLS